MIAKPSWLYYVRQFPRQSFAMLFFLTLAGVVESVGAVSLLPLLGGLFGKDSVKTLFTEPDSPWEKGHCESYNGKLLCDKQDKLLFYTLKERWC